MTVKALPTLDLKGWVTDPVTLGAKLLLYTLRSEKGQSTDYDASIVSLPSLVVLYGTNPEKMAESTKVAIEGLFSRYYDYVKTIVKVVEKDDTSRYDLEIDVTYGNDNSSNSLGFNVFVSPDTRDVRGTIEKYNG